MSEQRQHYKYKVIAQVVKLHLNKNLNFQTKITWKRNVNKAETRTVVHEDCESIFEELLELELNLVYNHAESKFQQKMTEFTVVVIYQGKIKSGGHAKYDASEIVNNNYSNEPVKLNLLQCPDPEAYIEVVFNYEVVGQCSRSLFNELSMLNPSGFEQDLSQLDFKEDNSYENRSSEQSIKRQSLSIKQNVEDLPLRERELSKINNILDKFQHVSRKLATGHKSTFLDTTKNESLQISSIPSEQEERLRTKVSQLQNELELKTAIIEDYQKKFESANRRIQELQLKLELADEKIKQISRKSHSSLDLVVLAESQQKYKQLYERSLQEIEELKDQVSLDCNFSKENKNFKNFLEEAHQINEVPQFQTENETSRRLAEKIDEQERENVEMQNKIAQISHNIAQLFNAAYEYGGAKLLDYLQNSIGLIEQDS